VGNSVNVDLGLLGGGRCNELKQFELHVELEKELVLSAFVFVMTNLCSI
jgi:hypothetical protein